MASLSRANQSPSTLRLVHKMRCLPFPVRSIPAIVPRINHPHMESTMPQSSTEENRKPVDKFTDGRVHVSIWENSGVKGAFRAATFQLRYKDQRDEWQTGPQLWGLRS